MSLSQLPPPSEIALLKSGLSGTIMMIEMTAGFAMIVHITPNDPARARVSHCTRFDELKAGYEGLRIWIGATKSRIF